jgi:hypothetical protein
MHGESDIGGDHTLYSTVHSGVCTQWLPVTLRCARPELFEFRDHSCIEELLDVSRDPFAYTGQRHRLPLACDRLRPFSNSLGSFRKYTCTVSDSNSGAACMMHNDCISRVDHTQAAAVRIAA